MFVPKPLIDQVVKLADELHTLAQAGDLEGLKAAITKLQEVKQNMQANDEQPAAD